MPKTTYLKSFTFPTDEREAEFCERVQRMCYDSFYPFKVLSSRGVRRVEFAPVTIFYGGNGSGKTTALNIIADKLGVKRDSVYNKSSFYPDYLDLCSMDALTFVPQGSRIITSDDVFDYMLNMRSYNQAIDRRRGDVFMDWVKRSEPSEEKRLGSLSEYDELMKNIDANRMTQSKYTRKYMPNNVKGQSNGETAFRYFVEKIDESGIYILDEPENSLSPARQLELVRFMEDSARFFECQFIISTHSPFMLGMNGAKIYDLDEYPAKVRPWTELENVRVYRDFFKEREDEFEA